jgi:RimJ/RimL family protein N-acetyltransferase
METLMVRRATVRDAGAIAQIGKLILEELGRESSALQEPMTAEAIAHRLRSYRRRGAMFVALWGKEAAGFAALEPSPEAQDTMVLGVWVLPKFRRRGVGTQLALAAMEHARRLGARRLRGTIPPDNEPALSFFGELGALAQAVGRGMQYELPL